MRIAELYKEAANPNALQKRRPPNQQHPERKARAVSEPFQAFQLQKMRG
jgi:hypothetical protein